MSEYKKQRDAAAYAHWLNVGTGNDCAEADFKAGSDWAHARTEKRIQELEEKLTSQKELNQKLAEGNSVLYEQKAELEQRAGKLVAALDEIVTTSKPFLVDINWDWKGLFSDLHNRAKQALKEWQEDGDEFK